MPRVKRTRRQVVDRALALASSVGLEGITLGVLAADLQLSKSGLFAHFRSKEALQLAVLSEAVDRFTRTVIAPALGSPRGEPRMVALFERFLAWIRTGGNDAAASPEASASGAAESGAFGESEEAGARRVAGGCIFMALSQEYDDRPGDVREALVRSQRDWRATIARVARSGIDEGHFRQDLDVEQFAFEFVGIGMTFQQAHRLLGDERAEARAREAFEGLLARSRARRVRRNHGEREGVRAAGM